MRLHFHRFKNTGRKMSTKLIPGKNFKEQRCGCGILRFVEVIEKPPRRVICQSCKGTIACDCTDPYCPNCGRRVF